MARAGDVGDDVARRVAPDPCARAEVRLATEFGRLARPELLDGVARVHHLREALRDHDHDPDPPIGAIDPDVAIRALPEIGKSGTRDDEERLVDEDRERLVRRRATGRWPELIGRSADR
jgi:hypothetical protein